MILVCASKVTKRRYGKRIEVLETGEKKLKTISKKLFNIIDDNRN